MSYDYGIAIDRLGLLVLSTESEECNSPFFVSLTDLCETESARSLSPRSRFGAKKIGIFFVLSHFSRRDATCARARGGPRAAAGARRPAPRGAAEPEAGAARGRSRERGS